MKKLMTKRLHYFIKLLPLIRENKKIAIALFILRFSITVVALIPPYIYKYYIEKVIVNGQINQLSYVIIGYAVLFLAQSTLVICFNHQEYKFVNKLKLGLKSTLLQIYSSMDYAEYEQQDIGDVRMRIESDTNVLCAFFVNHCINYLFAIVGSLIMLVIIFKLNWYLTLFGLIMIAISFFITKFLGSKIKRAANKYRVDQSDLESTIHDALQNWKEIKLNNLEQKENDLLDEKWSKITKSKLRMTKNQYLHGALFAFNLFFVTRMNLYFFGGLLIIKNLMSVSVMLVFMNYYEQIYANIQKVLDSIIALSAESAQIDKVFSILDHCAHNNIKDLAKLSEPIDFLGDISFNDVSFRYHDSKNEVLKTISIDVKRNKKLAIVGKSGSGKTTLAKLLVGLYIPSNGCIAIGQHNLNDIPWEIRSRYINIVMQDPVLFNMTILDNLLLAKPDATMNEIILACKKANIYDFIQSIPDNFNSLIGEKGIKLSGGQKQRLAIARTLLINPSILILDEATSSLDGESEEWITQQLHSIKEKTIISISHRFSTISESDQIIIMQDGCVAEKGPLKELIEESDLFVSIFPDKKDI